MLTFNNIAAKRNNRTTAIPSASGGITQINFSQVEAVLSPPEDTALTAFCAPLLQTPPSSE